MYGLGGGDIGAHIGTALLTANAGASVRRYLGPRVIGTLQSDVLFGANSQYSAWGSIDYFGIEGEAIMILTPRLTTATSSTINAYGAVGICVQLAHGKSMRLLKLTCCHEYLASFVGSLRRHDV